MSEEATLDDFATEADPDEEESTLRLGPKQVDIPASWGVSTFEETNNLDKPICYGVVKPGENIEDGTSLVKIEDVVDGYLSADQDFHQITDKKNKKYSRSQLSGGEILVSIQGTVGDAVIVPPEMEGANISRTIARITPEQPNNIWIKYYIESKPVQDYIQVVSSGSTRASYNIGDIRKTTVALPPLPEQRKIATVLYTVDRAIEKTDEILSQLNQVKQGLYQTLFSEGHLQHDQFRQSKYGEVPECWRISKLSEVTSQIQAGGTPDTDVAEYYGGDIPWVKTGELSQYRVTKTEQAITKKGLQESTARLFSPGTILIAMYGATTGEVSLLDIEATTNQACCGVVTTDEMRPEFLFHQLNHLSTHLESLSAGSGQQNISKGIIEKFDVLVPSVEEQDSIVRILNSVDKSIGENETTKNQYQRLKRGLMQDLLSGTVRTTDTNIEVPEEIAQYG